MPDQDHPHVAVSDLARLALPILLVAGAATAMRLLLPSEQPHWSTRPSLFTLAVALSAWLGGLYAGVIAAALAILLMSWAAIANGGVAAPLALPHLAWAVGVVLVALLVGSAEARRRHAVQLLGERDTRLRLVSEQIPAGLWSTDLELRLTSSFGGAPALFGAPPGAALTGIFQGEPDEHPAIAAHVRALRGEPSTFELERDGRVFQAHAEPLHDAAGEVIGVIGVALDVTDRKRDERRLQEAMTEAERSRAEAERATGVRDRFLAMLSHELRTPLTPAAMVVAELARRADLPAGVREDLELARRNIELEARLIDDLLDLTRVGAGKLRLDLRPTDAHRVVRHALDVCCAGAQEHNVDLAIDLTAERHHVRADAARLQQVVWNLVKNAIKFTPPGGRVTITTSNPDPEDPDRLVIEVSDTGMGIDREVLPRIFTAFEQGGASTTRRFGGLGLGLAITRELVEAHGGRITAESAGLGLGATFRVDLRTVALPASPAELQATVPAGPAADPTPGGPAAAAAAHRPLRVLLVEDDPDTRHVLSRLLRGAGHAVTTADTVASARLALESANGAVELLVSDLSLPDGTGLDVVRALRELRPAADAPVRAIAVSGLGTADDVRTSLDAGFDRHLTKPLSFDVLLHELEEVAAA